MLFLDQILTLEQVYQSESKSKVNLKKQGATRLPLSQGLGPKLMVMLMLKLQAKKLK